MRTELVYCDKCGRRIDGAFWFADLIKGTEILVGNYDICPDCMDRFMDASPEPAPDPDEPKPKKTRKIDRGKVWALRDADWKVSAIAGEMGCSEATIYNILNEGRPS